ncbi:NERD domain-containing protein [Streptomyces sp. SID4985]|uniref:nuclease-related domain-containing protein n=1 Tax=Streptomyces sp. SID4985 TaxID=2690292 RepID=UPI00136FA208|nr:nuclease-related domain-containing protein [Streptomyces sp. SID4985]MYQ45240.1 NERD domain-containing protein [Streptomyces sp. SID4985]
MSGLRVVPTRLRGRERLYVCGRDGRNVAWYDRESARVSLLAEDSRQTVLAALKPFLTGPVTVGPPPVPTPAELARLTLHPDDDLAPNRPGEALLVALDRAPGPAHRLRPDPRRHALTAEETVGAALDDLEGAGWHTLHSIPLPGGDRIHHLLIGPAGLFAVRALYARRQRVLVADPMVAVGRRAPEPLLRRLRADADRAAYALTAEVRPVLAVAGSAEVLITAAPRTVRILREEELAGLARLGGLLKPGDVEALHAMARDRRTWLSL